MISSLNYGRVVRLMVLLVIALVVSCAVYAGWDPLRASDAKKRQEELRATRGAHLFAQYCSGCHGKTGEGAVGPALNTPANQPADPNDLKVLQAKLFQTIRCGRVGTLMPAWHMDEGGALDDEQIRQLVLLVITNAGNAWDKAPEFFDEMADTGARVDQGRPVLPQDTVITVRKPESLTERAQYRLDEEVIEIARLDKGTGRLEVTRGLKGTVPAQHPDGSHVFTAPLDPPTGPINEGACGQRLVGAPPAATPPPTEVTPPPGAEAVLTVVGKEVGGRNLFQPNALAVRVGQKVSITFDNQGQVIHNLHIFGVVDSKDAVTKDIAVPGGRKSEVPAFTPTKAGSVKFQCDFHPLDMVGTLTVAGP